MQRIAPRVPTPRLDVRDLRVVIAIAQAGTTAKAAALLHLTQPAVSRALLAAEERLGVPLFARTSRGLTPTAAGGALIDGASRVLVELGELERRVAQPVAPPSRVRIVCECYTAYHWLPSMLAGLRRSMPDLEVVLAVEHTRDPVPPLEAHDVDIALLTTSQVPRGIEQKPLFRDEIVFLVSSTHPLASRRALSPDDLKAHTLITGLAAAEEGRWFMTRVFGRARPKLRFDRLPLTEAIVDVTRAGLGIAVLSEWIARPHLERGDLVAMRLSSGPLRRGWRMAWRPEVAHAAERLHAALRATAPSR